MQQHDSDIGPWYKQIWAWILLIILAVSIVHGLSLVYYAHKYADTMVVDNYYDVGKGINQSIERETLAKRLAVKAEIRLHDDRGVAELMLSGNSRPQLLTLNLISPTQAEKDRSVILQADMDGIYRGNLQDATEGRRIVEVLGREGDQEWRLVEEVPLHSGQPVTLDSQAAQ